MQKQAIRARMDIVDDIDGVRYRGKIDIGDSSFDYNLTLPDSIDSLTAEKLDEFLQEGSLEVRAKNCIPLNKESREVLKKELVALALEHYHHPEQQTLRTSRDLRGLNPGTHGYEEIGILCLFTANQTLCLSREYSFSPDQIFLSEIAN